MVTIFITCSHNGRPYDIELFFLSAKDSTNLEFIPNSDSWLTATHQWEMWSSWHDSTSSLKLDFILYIGDGSLPPSTYLHVNLYNNEDMVFRDSFQFNNLITDLNNGTQTIYLK